MADNGVHPVVLWFPAGVGLLLLQFGTCSGVKNAAQQLPGRAYFFVECVLYTVWNQSLRLTISTTIPPFDIRLNCAPEKLPKLPRRNCQNYSFEELSLRSMCPASRKVHFPRYALWVGVGCYLGIVWDYWMTCKKR